MREAVDIMPDFGETTRGIEAPDADMAPLIARVHALIERWRSVVVRDVGRVELGAFAAETGFKPRRQGKPELVLASEIAVELGHPSMASKTVVLPARRSGVVHANRITRRGPDLDEVGDGTRLAFGQVVMVELGEGDPPDPFQLEATALLINRLPGFMVRSVPGRQWVRVSKGGVASGVALETVGRALIAAYTQEFPSVEGVEVLFVTSSDAEVEALAPIALEATVASGRHKKLVLSAGGDLDCSELTCDECDERPVCDDLREVLRQRRKTR